MVVEVTMTTDNTVQDLHNWIDANADSMVSALQGVLRIASLEDAAAPNSPFGASCREALDYTLNLCETLGFSTHDDSDMLGMPNSVRVMRWSPRWPS